MVNVTILPTLQLTLFCVARIAGVKLTPGVIIFCYTPVPLFRQEATWPSAAGVGLSFNGLLGTFKKLPLARKGSPETKLLVPSSKVGYKRPALFPINLETSNH